MEIKVRILSKKVSGRCLSILDVMRSGPGVLSPKLLIAFLRTGRVRKGSFLTLSIVMTPLKLVAEFANLMLYPELATLFASKIIELCPIVEGI